MTEGNNQNGVVPSSHRSLGKLRSDLVRRGLDDFSKGVGSVDGSGFSETEGWVKRGIDLVIVSRYAEALHCFESAIKEISNHAPAWHWKGVALQRLGQFEQSLESYDICLEQIPDGNGTPTWMEYATWRNKGSLLRDLGRPQSSLQSYNRALEVLPEGVEACLGRAFVLHGLGRLNEALTSYERTLELNPRNFAAWINKALILQSQHRNAEALECFGKVTDLDPAYSWEEWNYKGLSFLELDRPGDALCCYEQACKLNSNDSTSWYNRAITEQRLGKMQDAANSYDKFLAVAEKSYTGLKAEEKKEMEANIEYARRRLKELRKAAPSVPKSPSTASTCSRCGHNSGIPAKFCANCGKALTS